MGGEGVGGRGGGGGGEVGEEATFILVLAFGGLASALTSFSAKKDGAGGDGVVEVGGGVSWSYEDDKKIGSD